MAVGPIPVGKAATKPTTTPKTTAPKPTQTSRPAAESFKAPQTFRPAAESFTPSPSTRTPTVVTPKPVVSTKPKTSTTSTVPAGTGTGGVTSGFPAAGTFAGWEYSADKKQRRMKFNDGQGGFYYGSYEANPESTEEETAVGTTNVQVLKAILTAKGLPSDLVEESVPFLQTLLKDGIDPESAVSIYLNSKSFTTKAGTVLASPFYNKYGFYNDKLTEKYDAATLFNTIEGYKGVASKYTLDPKFTSQDYIQKYLANKRSVAALDKAANTARLLATNADPLKVKTLQTLGYINNAQDLTDFYLDPNVGVEKMQQNVNTAAFAIEAIRRANTLAPFSATTAQQYGAGLTAQGLDEASVTALASQGYEKISQTLEPLTKTSGIYEGAAAKDAATIQSELEAEQFKGLESERRKRLAEQYARSLQGQSGITTQSLSTGAYLA